MKTHFAVLTLGSLFIASPLLVSLTPAPSSFVALVDVPKKDPPPKPYVKLDATKTVKPNRYFCLAPTTNCASIKWIVPAGLDPLDPAIPVKDPNVAVLIGEAGVYTVQAYGALGDQASDIASCVVTIGQPTPPKPPEPPVPPKPPVPPPSPAPIPVPGLRVLIVFDQLVPLPAAQDAIVHGQVTRDFLNSKCVLGPDGKTREFRIWDRGVDPTGDEQLWVDAFKRERKSVPWVVISNGTIGFEGPLPGNVADFQALVNKYAPAAARSVILPYPPRKAA